MAKKKEISYIGAVLTHECDSNNHMNVMYYVNKFELANRNFMGDLGVAAYLDTNGLGIAVVEQNIKYKKEVFEDQLLYVESELLRISDKAITTKNSMYEKMSGKLSAEMEVTSLMFDKEKRRAVSIPDDLRTKMETYL